MSHEMYLDIELSRNLLELDIKCVLVLTVISQASHSLVIRENSMMEITLMLVRHGQASHKRERVRGGFKLQGGGREPCSRHGPHTDRQRAGPAGG